MDEKKIEELFEKVKNGTATEEEKLYVLKIMNASVEAFEVLLKAVKEEQKV